MTRTPQRILVVRRDNIGDLVCTTPLLRALREALPQAHLAALVNSYNAGVLARNPALDAVHVYTKLKHRAAGGGVRGALAPLLARLGLIRRLRRERFDLAILARSGFDRHGLNFVRLLGIPRVVGFAAPGAAPRGISDPLPPPDNAALHEVEAVWQLLRPLGIDAAPGPLELFPDPAQVAAWRQTIRAGGGPVVAVHVSAREASRQLAVEKWIAFLHGLHAALPRTVPALFWSPGAEDDPRHPGDDGKARRILAGCAGLGVIPCPTQTLDELAAGLACCDAFVGADGGAMHVAAALRLPTVALFENLPFKLVHWHPWQVPHRIVAAPVRAIGEIEPAAMVAAVAALLAPRSAKD
jgi:ADP-heptose:LPS heptosyltransferase